MHIMCKSIFSSVGGVRMFKTQELNPPYLIDSNIKKIFLKIYIVVAWLVVDQIVGL
jgi:hypothetical protein